MSMLNPVRKAKPNGTELITDVSAVLVPVGVQNHPMMMPAMPPRDTLRIAENRSRWDSRESSMLLIRKTEEPSNPYRKGNDPAVLKGHPVLNFEQGIGCRQDIEGRNTQVQLSGEAEFIDRILDDTLQPL
jgi:hypothetical protein